MQSLAAGPTAGGAIKSTVDFKPNPFGDAPDKGTFELGRVRIRNPRPDPMPVTRSGADGANAVAVVMEAAESAKGNRDRLPFRIDPRSHRDRRSSQLWSRAVPDSGRILFVNWADCSVNNYPPVL